MLHRLDLFEAHIMLAHGHGFFGLVAADGEGYAYGIALGAFTQHLTGGVEGVEGAAEVAGPCGITASKRSGKHVHGLTEYFRVCDKVPVVLEEGDEVVGEKLLQGVFNLGHRGVVVLMVEVGMDDIVTALADLGDEVGEGVEAIDIALFDEAIGIDIVLPVVAVLREPYAGLLAAVVVAGRLEVDNGIVADIVGEAVEGNDALWHLNLSLGEHLAEAVVQFLIERIDEDGIEAEGEAVEGGVPHGVVAVGLALGGRHVLPDGAVHYKAVDNLVESGATTGGLGRRLLDAVELGDKLQTLELAFGGILDTLHVCIGIQQRGIDAITVIHNAYPC